MRQSLPVQLSICLYFRSVISPGSSSNQPLLSTKKRKCVLPYQYYCPHYFSFLLKLLHIFFANFSIFSTSSLVSTPLHSPCLFPLFPPSFSYVFQQGHSSRGLNEIKKDKGDHVLYINDLAYLKDGDKEIGVKLEEEEEEEKRG